MLEGSTHGSPDLTISVSSVDEQRDGANRHDQRKPIGAKNLGKHLCVFCGYDLILESAHAARVQPALLRRVGPEGAAE